MAIPKSKISIVCPALNEEEVLPLFHRELCRVLARLEDVHDFEILYVDDGSSDGTLGLLREFAEDDRIRYLSLSRNFGHQAAFLAGLEQAEGDAVILMDSDLQHPPAIIPELLQRWEQGHDLVLTIRQGGRPGGLTSLAARCFVSVLGRLSPLKLRANMSDYVLLSRRVADDMIRLRESHRYLRGMIQWLGYSAGEVPFTPPPRPAGRTKFNPARLLGYSLDALVSFSRAPLQLAYVFSLLCLVVGLGILGRGMIGVIWPGWRVESWALWLLASLHLVGGAILLVLGLVGEYIGRILEQVKARPLYLVRETEQDQPRWGTSAGRGARRIQRAESR